MIGFDKAIIALVLSFVAGAMIAHALVQPVHNLVHEIELKRRVFIESAIIGYVSMDPVTKELHFEAVK